MASRHSRPSATTSPLLRLPAPLLTVVLSYLPLPLKCCTLTHLCHSFPRPTTAAFQHDHLNLSPTCLLYLLDRPHIVALLEQLPCARVALPDMNAVEARDAGSHLSGVLSPSTLNRQPFTSLCVLDLCRVNSPFLQTFASSAPPLPLLHTLAVSVKEPRFGNGPIPDNTALLSKWMSELASLRHLSWSMWVNVRALYYLFSMPLRSLDLSQCRLSSTLSPADRSHTSHSSASLDTVSGTLHRLYLPSNDFSDASERTVCSHLAKLLQRYAESREEGSSERKQVEVDEEKAGREQCCPAPTQKWRLQHLQYALHCLLDTLEYATAISSLTSLHISRFSSPETLNSFFLAASPASLPHLSRLVVPVDDVDSRRADETAISEACVAFFPAFAAQLQHLKATSCSPSARSQQRLFASVLTCTRLVTLQVICSIAVGRPVALPARIASMPLLHKLTIHSPTHRSGRASHLQHADVVRLLDSCAALRVLSLTLPNASVGLLPSIARACSQLRQLHIHSDDIRLWETTEELIRAAAAARATSVVPLAHVHSLSIDHHLKAGQSAPQPTATLLSALSSLLGRAPVRRLCLLPHIDAVGMPFYASFPHLVRLRVHDTALGAILRHYCRHAEQPPLAVLLDADRRREGRMALTVSDSGADEEEEEGDADECQTWSLRWLSCPAFEDERLFVSNERALTGREAWMERAQAMAAAEMERRRAAELQIAQKAAEEASKQQQKQARKSRKNKAPEASAAEAFFAASGIKRKR